MSHRRDSYWMEKHDTDRWGLNVGEEVIGWVRRRPDGQWAIYSLEDRRLSSISFRSVQVAVEEAWKWIPNLPQRKGLSRSGRRILVTGGS